MGCSGTPEGPLLVSDDEDGFDLIVSSLLASFSCLSPPSWPKSLLVPGVLGVLADEPKDAKAPVPSPKAEEAPVVGDATAALSAGVRELKGLALPPCEDVSPPKRFVAEKVRGESDFKLSLLPFGLEVAKESLLELEGQRLASDGFCMSVSSYFDLRCHKLSIEADQQFPRVVKLASGGWMDMDSPDGLGQQVEKYLKAVGSEC